MAPETCSVLSWWIRVTMWFAKATTVLSLVLVLLLRVPCTSVFLVVSNFDSLVQGCSSLCPTSRVISAERFRWAEVLFQPSFIDTEGSTNCLSRAFISCTGSLCLCMFFFLNIHCPGSAGQTRGHLALDGPFRLVARWRPGHRPFPASLGLNAPGL